jgi:hypothetical protein
MQHLSEEERGRVENQLLKALEEALIQFQQATIRYLTVKQHAPDTCKPFKTPRGRDQGD